MDKIFASLEEAGFFWDEARDFIRSDSFISFKVGWEKSETLLKLDFVNDSVPHFGGIQRTALFDRTDSIRNILSNKLSALFRYAGKDVVDIREIALHETIDWTEIINEARAKEAGLEIPVISEILKGMPREEFEAVSWTQKPDWEVFCADMDRIVFDMIG
jgi:hypothetical protein